MAPAALSMPLPISNPRSSPAQARSAPRRYSEGASASVITEIRSQRGTIASTVPRSAARRTASAARSTGIGRGRRRPYVWPAVSAKPVSIGPRFTTDTAMPRGRQLGREGPAEAVDGVLGGRVRRLEGHPDAAGDRADEDDPAPPRGLHRRHGGPHGVHRTEDVGPHEGVERLVREIGERPVGTDAGVGHQHVQAPEPVDDGVDGGPHGGGITDVARHRQPAGQERDGLEVPSRTGEQGDVRARARPRRPPPRDRARARPR